MDIRLGDAMPNEGIRKAEHAQASKPDALQERVKPGRTQKKDIEKMEQQKREKY